MKVFSANIPTYLGDLIIVKTHMDQVKHLYSQINLTFHTALWKEYLQTRESGWADKERGWRQYLNDMGKLFFSEKPYLLNRGQYKVYYDLNEMIKNLRITPTKPELSHILCKGTPLNLGEEYIVITTKIRHIRRTTFYPLSIELWSTLKELSKKYKIVILGEREVEKRREYEFEGIKDGIFGIYEQIITNLPKDRIHDLTIPSLGNTPSNIQQIQQDCLIMKHAKFVITIGVGGNFCMSTAVSNMAIGWRQDDIWITDMTFNNKVYPNALITKDWNAFINKLKEYL